LWIELKKPKAEIVFGFFVAGFCLFLPGLTFSGGWWDYFGQQKTSSSEAFNKNPDGRGFCREEGSVSAVLNV
jgi:hypothetical protein